MQYVDYIQGTSLEELKELVNAALFQTFPTAEVAAVRRKLLFTATQVPEEGDTFTIGGLDIVIGNGEGEVAAGEDAIEFITNLGAALDTGKATIPAAVVTDNEDATLGVEMVAGKDGNDIEVSTNITGLTYEQTQEGVDLIPAFDAAEAVGGMALYQTGGEAVSTHYVREILYTVAAP